MPKMLFECFETATKYLIFFRCSKTSVEIGTLSLSENKCAREKRTIKERKTDSQAKDRQTKNKKNKRKKQR
jgi:hypothetical protein